MVAVVAEAVVVETTSAAVDATAVAPVVEGGVVVVERFVVDASVGVLVVLEIIVDGSATTSVELGTIATDEDRSAMAWMLFGVSDRVGQISAPTVTPTISPTTATPAK